MSGIAETSGSKAKTPFLAFVNKEADQKALKAFAVAKGFGEDCVLPGDITSAAQYLRNHSSPEVLIVEIPSAESAPALLDALADSCDPGTKVVITGNVNEYSFYCWLTEIGISSYMLLPLSEAGLESTWQKIHQPVAAGAKAAKEPGKLIGVIGTRGGSGATSISILLAGILSKYSGKNVALVDLDPQDGSISLLLDLEASRGFREALEKPDRIDSLFLDRVMVKASDNLHILSTEDSFNDVIVRDDNAAEILLTTLKERFDLIVLDLSRSRNHFIHQCMRACETVFIIAEPTLLSLRDSMRMNDYFREKVKTKQPVFVVNRIGAAAKFELSIKDFEKSLGAKVDYHIPYAPEVFMTMDPNFPALKQVNAPAVSKLTEMAKKVFPEMEATGKTTSKKSLFMKAKK